MMPGGEGAREISGIYKYTKYVIYVICTHTSVFLKLLWYSYF